MAHPLKICLLGELGVGKTSFVARLVSNQFVDEFDIYFDESYRKMIEVEGEGVLLEVLDPHLVDVRAMMWDGSISCCEVFLILYSVGEFETFRKVREGLELIYRVKERGDVPIIVVGHKIDLELEREVSKEEGEEYVGLHEGVLFMEASAKTGENVKEVFQMAVKRYRELERERNGVDEGGKERGRRKRNENVPPPPIVHDIIQGRTVKPAKR